MSRVTEYLKWTRVHAKIASYTEARVLVRSPNSYCPPKSLLWDFCNSYMKLTPQKFDSVASFNSMYMKVTPKNLILGVYTTQSI